MKNILIVNEKDEVIGEADKLTAREKGMYHRIVRILVFNKSGQILLQKRSSNSKFDAGSWDQSAGGHVDAGENDTSQAAKRELKEELGIDAELEFIDKYFVEYNDHQIIRRFNYLYRCTYDGQFEIQPEEVDEVKWFDVSTLKELVNNGKLETTAGLKLIVNKYLN